MQEPEESFEKRQLKTMLGCACIFFTLLVILFLILSASSMFH
jgi:hypothetical protein